MVFSELILFVTETIVGLLLHRHARIGKPVEEDLIPAVFFDPQFVSSVEPVSCRLHDDFSFLAGSAEQGAHGLLRILPECVLRSVYVLVSLGPPSLRVRRTHLDLRACFESHFVGAGFDGWDLKLFRKVAISELIDFKDFFR